MPTDAILTYSGHIVDRRLTPRRRNRSGPDSYADYLRIHYRFYQDAALPEKPSILPAAPAFVNAGRWVWQCQACYEGGMVEPGEAAICAHCGDGWVMPMLPANRAAIEEELLRQPGRRHNAPVRHWRPGWTLDTLRARTAKADALIAAGNANPRALSIGATRVWVTGEILTASNENLYVSTPIDDISGDNGIIEFRDSLQVLDGAGDKVIYLPNGTTAQRPASPSNGQIRYNSSDHRLDIRANGAWQQAAHLSDVQPVTFEQLDSVGDVGIGADQLIQGNHAHMTLVTADLNYRANTNIPAYTNPNNWVNSVTFNFNVAAGTTHILVMPIANYVSTDMREWRFSIDGGTTFSSETTINRAPLLVMAPATATTVSFRLYFRFTVNTNLGSRNIAIVQLAQTTSV